MIFISYSRKNVDIVLPLVKLLSAAGQEVFLDVQNMEYGEDWRAQIKAAIQNCDRFLVFWSSSSQASEAVREECELALSKGCRVIPILLDKTPLPLELEHFHGTEDLTSIFSNIVKLKSWRWWLWLSWIIIAAILAILGALAAMGGFLGPPDWLDVLKLLLLFFVVGFIAYLILLALPFLGLTTYLKVRSDRYYSRLVDTLIPNSSRQIDDSNLS